MPVNTESFEKCGLDYWKQKWQDHDIDFFHKQEIHPLLEKHLDKLFGEEKSAKIFFPLCGKAVDMFWLASLGHRVIGVDIAEKAIQEFFTENNLKHVVEESGDFKLYRSMDSRIKLYQGDFFKFTTKYEGPIECIWDRGSLVALPPQMRIRYSQHFQTLLADKFRYLIDTLDYDQNVYPGPPHCVKLSEITQLYGAKCKITQVDCIKYPCPDNLRKYFNDANMPDEYAFLLTNQ